MSERRAASRALAQDSARPGWNAPALRGDMPDINVWLALAVQEHPHHAAARAYWEQPGNGLADGVNAVPNGRSLWFCRTTMLGLVRLLCQPKVVGPGALSLLGAWQVYRNFLAVPGVAMFGEPVGVEAQLQSFLQSQSLPPRYWTDAWLAATAVAGGLRLVSFDRDFERFALPNSLLLTA